MKVQVIEELSGKCRDIEDVIRPKNVAKVGIVAKRRDARISEVVVVVEKIRPKGSGGGMRPSISGSTA